MIKLSIKRCKKKQNALKDSFKLLLNQIKNKKYSGKHLRTSKSNIIQRHLMHLLPINKHYTVNSLKKLMSVIPSMSFVKMPRKQLLLSKTVKTLFLGFSMHARKTMCLLCQFSSRYMIGTFSWKNTRSMMVLLVPLLKPSRMNPIPSIKLL